MLFPLIAAWVKESHLLRLYFIPPCRCHRFMEIAGFAGESKVLRAIIAARGTWMDMLYLKGEVEYLLWCMAVFASIPRPFRHNRIKWVHDFAGCVA